MTGPSPDRASGPPPGPPPGYGDVAALVLIGTPIGNLGDIAPRAIEELARADVVACEDTRRTGKLLQHVGVRAPRLLVVNEHTEERAGVEVLERLARGERVAIVSDAGMPGISDPGERLVRTVSEAGFRVEVIPGPSAGITALVGSGLPAGRFVFEGFLPRKGAGRTDRLTALATEPRTILFYEAPHRLARTIGDLVAVMGPARRIVLARELTKLHEEVWRGTLGDAVERTEEHEPRGEYVLVLEGAPAGPVAADDELLASLARHRGAGNSTKDAVAAVADEYGVPRKRVYALATQRPHISEP